MSRRSFTAVPSMRSALTAGTSTMLTAPAPEAAAWQAPDYVPPVFIISLERTPERTAEALAQLAPLGIPLTVFRATDGAAEIADLPRDPHTVHCMQPGEVGICMSWWRVAARIVRDNLPMAMVFEDDVQLLRGGVVDAIRALPADAHFAQLVAWNHPEFQPLRKPTTAPWIPVARPSWTTAAYAVTNRGAREILRQTPPFDRPIDIWLQENLSGMSMYRVKPEDAWFEQSFWRRSTARATAHNAEIPKMIHRIWLGHKRMPQRWTDCGQSWRAHHSWQDGWRHRLWDDIDLSIGVTEELAAYPELKRPGMGPAERSDLLRLVLLYEFGGLYVDTDFECLAPFDRILKAGCIVAAEQAPGSYCNGFLAAAPKHPWIKMMLDEARERIAAGRPILEAAGPQLVTDMLAGGPAMAMRKPLMEGPICRGWAHGDEGLVTVSAPTLFPYQFHERDPGAGNYGTAMAAHHWGRSWWSAEQWETFYQAHPELREEAPAA